MPDLAPAPRDPQRPHARLRELLDGAAVPDQRWGQLQWLVGVLLLNLAALAIESTQTADLTLALLLRLGVLLPLTLLGLAINRWSDNLPLNALTSAAPIFGFVAIAATLGQFMPEPAASKHMMAALFMIFAAALSAALSWRHTKILTAASAAVFLLIVGSGLSLPPRPGNFDLIALGAVITAGGLNLRRHREAQTIEMRRIRRIDADLSDQLSEANSRLSRLSTTDALTSLYNRRVLDDLLQRWSDSADPAPPHGVLMIDVDHFKLFNDHGGHAEGDRCLQQIASTLKATLRTQDDIIVRYGGEEFAIVLEGANLAETLSVAERLRSAVVDLGLPHPGLGPPHCVTVSIGACASPPAESVATTIACADAALYSAKQAGRNRVAA